MENKNSQQLWNEYVDGELKLLTPTLNSLGFKLEDNQPHIIGERFLMTVSTIGSGKKLILMGRRISDNKKVVIKATRDSIGKKELERERKSRNVLQNINFAYDTFLSPEEILSVSRGGFDIEIAEFVDQRSTFLERPIEEQFSLALLAFNAQESAHSTTYEHEKLIKKTFESFSSKEYVNNFELFKTKLSESIKDEEVSEVLNKGFDLLKQNTETIDQYSGFLTHVDFVPHNFRVKGGKLYLLDHSSIRFGNKYEGWARFLNFMALYNPPLEKALTDYVHNNRTTEEHLSLKLMRVYRLGEIIYYYSRTLRKVVDDLHSLNLERIHFWSKILKAVLDDVYVSKDIIDNYKKTRDSLRSEEEKKRQIGLH